MAQEAIQIEGLQLSGGVASEELQLRSRQATQIEAPQFGNLCQKRGTEKAQIKQPERARLVPGEKLLAHILIGFAPGLDPHRLVGAGQIVQQ